MQDTAITPEPVAAPTVTEPAKSAIETDSRQTTTSSDTEQVVVFRLAGEEYAAPILDVQEIITTGDITPFPNMPEYIAGIINVRGTVATIINLANRFSLNREESQNIDKYIILTYTGKALFGIMVDEVTSVMKIPKDNIKAAAGITESKICAEYVRGVAVIDERVILILDFHKVLEEEALKKFAESQTSEKPGESPTIKPVETNNINNNSEVTNS